MAGERDRRVLLEGTTNVRDLGGYPTVDGGTTARGVVYRADGLHKLTSGGLEGLAALGVRAIYDLRGEAERNAFPNPVESAHLPIVGRPPGAPPRVPIEGAGSAEGEAMLRDMYVGTLAHSSAGFGALFTALADASHRPAIFHCHGGKDRTGVAAALLLSVLGVDREPVLDDYELTRRFRTIEDQADSRANMLAMGLSPEAAAGVLGTPRWTMAAALDALDHTYGGVDAYLTGPGGLDPSVLAALRADLVDR